MVSHREEFCRLALMAGANRRELCRRFGIAPMTGFKWLRRFEAEGPAGLADRSRRPLSSPERSSAAAEAQVLAVRAAHPAWGGRKIRRVLQNEGAPTVPAASTVTAILRRHGMLEGPRAASRGPMCASSTPARTISGRWTSRVTSRWRRGAAIRSPCWTTTRASPWRSGPAATSRTGRCGGAWRRCSPALACPGASCPTTARPGARLGARSPPWRSG
jgi:transposase-like protein